MKYLLSLSVLAIGLPFSSLASEAHACSCGEDSYFLESLPADGDKGVPTNVVPWVEVVGRSDPRLFDSEGTELSLKTTQSTNPYAGCERYFELFPDAELQPNSTYTLLVEDEEAEDGVGEKLSFTTGEGPLEESELPPPAVTAAFFNTGDHIDDCVEETIRGCITGKAEGLLELRTLTRSGQGMDRDDEEHSYVIPFSDAAFAYLSDYGDEVCLELRARDIAGRRSQPRSWCRSIDSIPYRPSKVEAAAYEGEVPSCNSELVKELRSAEITVTEAEDTKADDTKADDTKADDTEADDTEADDNSNVDEGSGRATSGCSVQAGHSPPSVWLLTLLPLCGLLARRRRASSRLSQHYF